MSQPQKQSKWQYVHFSRTWYAKSGACRLEDRCMDEVMFGDYCETGGCEGEMAMRWFDLQDHDRRLTPQLQVFNDAWAVLARLPELVQELGKLNDQHITPEQFCALLDRLGFEDATEEVRKDD